MSKKYRKVGNPLLKIDAVAMMLTKWGVKICHEAWRPSEWLMRVGEVVVDSRGNMTQVGVGYGRKGMWYIVEEVKDSPEKLELTQEIEGLKSSLAELEKKLEAMR